jgi:predicted Zn-dependent peptidase
MDKFYSVHRPNLSLSKSRFLAVAFLLVGIVSPIQGQSSAEPIREQLLNGLTILFWQRAADANVTVKLRINSGAAFDLAGKDGMMSLLGNALFPDASTREYVTEELGGKLDVTTDFDAIEVTITGKASEFERMVELLRNAVLTMQMSPENVARLRDERIKQLSTKSLTPSEIADRAVAKRLFGHFPYSHTVEGTPETILKIERGDLMLARERFMNADNAALAIYGGVDKARAMRTVRQLLGPWTKGDRKVPATFRQPDAPDSRVLIVNSTDSNTTEVRIAARGVARFERDEAAAALLARVVRDRWLAAVPDLTSIGVHHEAHALAGIFVMRATAPNASVQKAISAARQVIGALAQSGSTGAELETARNDVLTGLSQRKSPVEALEDAWLDTITFRSSVSSIGSANTLVDSVRSATPSDIQRAAARFLNKTNPIAIVVVGNSQQLRASLTDAVEVRTSSTDTNTSSSSSTSTRKP